MSLRAEETTGRQYAMKRMRKTAVVSCPEHVLCEQAITRNTAHPFCIRQYASFQDKYHLYFLFDLMSGGDLMDVLVAEAKVIKRRAPHGIFQQACFAPKVSACSSLPVEHPFNHNLAADGNGKSTGLPTSSIAVLPFQKNAPFHTKVAATQKTSLKLMCCTCVLA